MVTARFRTLLLRTPGSEVFDDRLLVEGVLALVVAVGLFHDRHGQGTSEAAHFASDLELVVLILAWGVSLSHSGQHRLAVWSEPCLRIGERSTVIGMLSVM